MHTNALICCPLFKNLSSFQINGATFSTALIKASTIKNYYFRCQSTYKICFK